MKPKSNVQMKTPRSPPTSKKRPAAVKKPLPVKKARVSGERVTSAERRTSGRNKSTATYVEAGESTDDERMEQEGYSTAAEEFKV